MGNTIQQSKKAMSSNDDRFKCVMTSQWTKQQRQQRFITFDMANMFELLTQNQKFLKEFVITNCAKFVYMLLACSGLKTNSLISFIVVKMRIESVKWKSSAQAHSLLYAVIKEVVISSQPSGRTSTYGQWLLFMGILLVADRLIIYFAV